MTFSRVRIKNRILQAMYRPRVKSFVPINVMRALDDIDKGIEEKITPFLAEFFEVPFPGENNEQESW